MPEQRFTNFRYTDNVLPRFPVCSFQVSATPILDLHQAPPEPRKFKFWRYVLIGVTLGAAIATIKILEEENIIPAWDPPTFPAFNGLLLLPAVYLAIAFHEIGHLLAGKLVGLNTGGISVGAFVLLRSGKNWVFRFDRDLWLSGGSFKPLTGTVRFRQFQYAWLLAGGPFASVVLTIVCGLMWVQYGGGAWSWIGTFLWASLFIDGLSLVPFSAGLQKSDSALLLQFIRYPEQARSWMALLTLQTEDAKGVRPREWDPQSFEQILMFNASANEYLYCQFMAYYRRLDRGLGSRGVGAPGKRACGIGACGTGITIFVIP